MRPSNYRLSLLLVTIGFASFFPICKSRIIQPASASSNIPEAFDYEAFQRKYNKSYGLLEKTSRAKLFCARTLDIYKANVLYVTRKRNYYLDQNAFIDLSPAEIRNLFINTNHDLPPVKEAKISPETPADYFIIHDIEESDSSDIYDQVTRSSLSDLSSPVEDEEHFGLDSFESSETPINIDPPKFIQKLSKLPNTAKQISKVINIKGTTYDRSSHGDSNQKKSAIPYNPVVKPTNPNFDPDTVDTRGFEDKMDRYNQFYSNILMDDFLGFLEPYPIPAEPDTQNYGNNDDDDDNRGLLGRFVDTLQVFRHLMIADDGMLENNQNETKPDKEPKNSQHSNESGKDSKGSGLVYNIDWGKTGCIPRVKNQGSCSSCYAFATLDLLEYFYCCQMGEATEFSAQYMVDCGARSGLNGCQGGRLSSVKEFITSYGLQVSALYPYVAKRQTCRYHESELDNSYLVKPNIKRWGVFFEIKAWYKWIFKSPIIVGINMPDDFLAYGGGIHDGLGCIPEMGHAMLLVGAGREDGKPFWLLKNAFSEDWGEKGYFRLSRSAPIKCFDSAVVARFEFKDLSNQDKILARVSRKQVLQ